MKLLVLLKLKFNAFEDSVSVGFASSNTHGEGEKKEQQDIINE